MYTADGRFPLSTEIAVIIPAFNEELTIGSVVLRAKMFSDNVIVVDDGSSDRTSETAAMAGAKVLRLEKNSGKAAAVMKGFAELETIEYSVAVMIDADGQHYPEDIPNVIAPIITDEADLVIGSRFMDGTAKVPMYRRVGQKVLDRFTNLGTGQEISDTQSGFRAMSKKGVQNMDFRSSGYSIESAMIMHFVARGLRIREVPINVSYDVPNKHKKNPLSMGVGLINSLILEIGQRRPLLFFGLPGAIMGLAGVGLGMALLTGSAPFGWSWQLTSTLAQSLVYLGALMAVAGLSLSSLSKIIRNQNGIRSERSDLAQMEVVRVETVKR
ncbi:MAG: glycosyltransferase family 2 protein [Methanomassiliicoccus sp.]|nr:glycosyltransferase family 2 protein [Methanomassiliicoccus sp.]